MDIVLNAIFLPVQYASAVGLLHCFVLIESMYVFVCRELLVLFLNDCFSLLVLLLFRVVVFISIFWRNKVYCCFLLLLLLLSSWPLISYFSSYFYHYT